MTKDGLTEAHEDVGAMTVGRKRTGSRNGNRNRNTYGGGADDRPAVAVAVMPLWDRPGTEVCR
ncbi:hypothetical protein [Streptomyces guryensis]|uniref:Uncharacterized protein n=1 Tax=Streptomyces guryensis TaxID=2886947 RepID=A0A9Q3VM75_9ACTN|nr:hypothetical protein [Streptomyces guryensis]MCD9873430.1 hypothetical protein [Streptomyces guryensis]